MSKDLIEAATKVNENLKFFLAGDIATMLWLQSIGATYNITANHIDLRCVSNYPDKYWIQEKITLLNKYMASQPAGTPYEFNSPYTDLQSVLESRAFRFASKEDGLLAVYSKKVPKLDINQVVVPDKFIGKDLFVDMKNPAYPIMIASWDYLIADTMNCIASCKPRLKSDLIRYICLSVCASKETDRNILVNAVDQFVLLVDKLVYTPDKQATLASVAKLLKEYQEGTNSNVRKDLVQLLIANLAGNNANAIKAGDLFDRVSKFPSTLIGYAKNKIGVGSTTSKAVEHASVVIDSKIMAEADNVIVSAMAEWVRSGKQVISFKPPSK